MKKITLSVLMLSSYLGFAQNHQVYKGNVKGQDLILTVGESEYFLGTSIGKISNETKNTIKLTSSQTIADVQVFLGKSENTEAVFTCSNYDFANGKFKIGYLDQQNKKEYLDVVVNDFEQSLQDKIVTNLNIPKTSKVFLLINFDTIDAIEFEYALPENAKQITFDVVNPYKSIQDTTLDVRFNDDKSEITISDNGVDEITFYKEIKSSHANSVRLTPTNKVKLKSTLLDGADDANAVAIDYEFTDYLNMIEVKTTNSIDSGLKKIKTTDDTFLVVLIENEKMNPKLKFDTVLDGYKTNITRDLYFGEIYDQATIKAEIEALNKYVFHLATKADTKWLKKQGIDINKPAILFIDKNGEILKQNALDEISISAINSNFETHATTPSTLKGLSKVNELYKLVQKNTIKDAEFITLLEQIFNNNLSLRNAYLPVPANIDEFSDTYYEYNLETNFKYNFPDFTKTKLEAHYTALLNRNFKKFDKNLIPILEAELSRNGFSSIIFNRNSSSKLTDNDYKAIDLLLSNLTEVKEAKQTLNQKNVAESSWADAFSYPNLSTENIILQAINSQVYNFDENSYISDSETKRKVLAILKRMFINDTEEMVYLTRYYDVVTNNEIDIDYTQPELKELATLYAKYYATTFENATSFIEVLDARFESKVNNSDGMLSWSDYKNLNANLANNVAWSVVESKETNLYAQALKWAELAVGLDKNSPYFLDTLGHLYYFTGNKQKAIEVQTKAVEAAMNEQNPSLEFSTTSVLNKMKANKL